MSLVPAYGKVYNSVKALTEGLDSGKDFILNDISDKFNGLPCSPRVDFKGQTRQFRYGKRLEKVTMIKC